MPRGVGLIGAGPGVEALHLPTLNRLAERFRAVHIADAGGGRATALARVRGIRSSTGIIDLTADPDVEVVAVCSPPALHAEHALAAIAAGARALFVEKPLALTASDAEAVVAASRDAGVALVVGTNHLYDPAWGRAKHHLLASGAPVRTITVSVSLPPNHPLHDAVTEMIAPAGAPARGGGPSLDDPLVAAAVVRQLVSGLLVHDLPLVRDLAPSWEEVVFARPLRPVGAAVGFRASGVLVQLSAVLVPEGSEPDWRMSITTDGERVDIRFPPSFLHAGGAEVAVTGVDGRRTVYAIDDLDGYVAEWAALADLLDDGAEPEWTEIADDARYTVTVADAAAELISRARQHGSAHGVGRTGDGGADTVAAGATDDRALPALRGTSAVLVADDGFRVSVAALPQSAHLTKDPRGAIVAGRVDTDAAALVLRTPVDVGAVPSRVAVILVRPFLRPDVVADALGARTDQPRLVVGECAAERDDDPVIADAIGWLRVLTGRPLELVATARTPEAALAAFAAGEVIATLSVTLGAPRAGLRVRGLGETTTEVVVDAPGRATVTTSTADGVTTAPRRWEDIDRVALRRAIAAVGNDVPPEDLADLARDAAHAASVITAVDPQDRRPAVAGLRSRAETEDACSREDRR